MSESRGGRILEKCFPARRFDADFPIAVWLAGLWLYLKGFLYICYLYMLGLEPAPYSLYAQIEIVYFLIAFLPALILGFALWNEKRWAVKTAAGFFLIDTPFLLFHVWRLMKGEFLDTGLVKFLEFGSLGLNLLALGMLAGLLMQEDQRAR